MVESLSIDGLLPRSIIEQIIAKPMAVPLFVEEITRAVTDLRTQVTEAHRFRFRSSLTVPDTLHASLMARLVSRRANENC